MFVDVLVRYLHFERVGDFFWSFFFWKISTPPSRCYSTVKISTSLIVNISTIKCHVVNMYALFKKQWFVMPCNHSAVWKSLVLANKRFHILILFCTARWKAACFPPECELPICHQATFTNWQMPVLISYSSCQNCVLYKLGSVVTEIADIYFNCQCCTGIVDPKYGLHTAAVT